MPSRLSPEDQQKVEQYLSSPVHQVERAPFKPWLMMAGLASFGLIVACFAGACPAFMVEAFPKHVRCSGLSVGYNLSLSIFGGTVPLVSVALIAATGDRLAPAFYLMLAAALSFVMATLIDAHPDEARAGW